MARIKQSVTFWAFSKAAGGARELIQAAAEIGYDSVEMLDEQYWPLVKEAGLKIAIIGGHRSLTDGLNKPENHDRIEKELRESIRKAAANGIPSLITFSGNRNGLADDRGVEICAAGLKRVIKEAEDYGVDLCMELLNSKVNHPDYQCDHTSWGVKLCQAVDSPRCKLLYDIYHMQIMEGDLIRTIGESVQYIGHFHTAGNPGRHDLDDQQEIYYPAVMRKIAETGYAGYVGHEFSPKGDWKQAMQAAYDACNVG
ncbi:MAG TPA: TIM barrel protein [Limnochordia bacterium]|nr:TIM barrel protein [Limnochordia bacterium]